MSELLDRFNKENCFILSNAGYASIAEARIRAGQGFIEYVTNAAIRIALSD
jgi:hypothetical protein